MFSLHHRHAVNPPPYMHAPFSQPEVRRQKLNGRLRYLPTYRTFSTIEAVRIEEKGRGAYKYGCVGWVGVLGWLGPGGGGEGGKVSKLDGHMQGYICHDRPGAVCCSLELKKKTHLLHYLTARVCM